MSFPLLSSPPRPSFHLPHPARGTDSRSSQLYPSTVGPCLLDQGVVVVSRSGWRDSGCPRDHRHTASCSRKGRRGAPEPATGARRRDRALPLPMRLGPEEGHSPARTPAGAQRPHHPHPSFRVREPSVPLISHLYQESRLHKSRV